MRQETFPWFFLGHSLAGQTASRVNGRNFRRLPKSAQALRKTKGPIRTSRNPVTRLRYGKGRSNALVGAPVTIPGFPTREEGVTVWSQVIGRRLWGEDGWELDDALYVLGPSRIPKHNCMEFPNVPRDI